MTAATPRLARLLALVPYLVARPGVPVSEVTEVFGITEDELRKDLDLLFVCGLPGYSPGDLIDVSFTGDRITVSNAEAIARPLRLTPEEAVALVVAARSLAAVPGLAERGSLDRALVKLQAACAPVVAEAVETVTVDVEPAGETLALLEGALKQGRRVRLTYHSAARDEVTERAVDPMRLVMVDGWWYLEAWCRRVDDVRLFRLDRVVAAEVLDDPAEVPAEAVPRDLDEGVFRPSVDHELVVLEVGSGARWVADYYPCERVEEVAEPAGGLRLALRVADPAWVVRLVLRLGAQATLVEPERLAVEVRDQAQRALSPYAAND
ncbi:MAG TPA: WYL domain-containing protein [Mycobacteriales bacterium]|nr:WYL domain-containing protein [Mycobacteriales bacterium]